MISRALVASALVLFALVGPFITGGRAQQASIASAGPAQDAVYMCPMHPDVRGQAGEKCSRCGMALVLASSADYKPYLLDFDLTPRALHAGETGRIRFLVRNPKTGAAIRHFETVHERSFHLFIVSQDLQYFAHVHPILRTSGELDLDVRLPHAGVYQLVADFVPTSAAPQLVQRVLVTADYLEGLGAIPQLVTDQGDRADQGTRVQLLMSPLIAGREQLITLGLGDARTGEPVDDLEPYLGATGHLFAASADLSTVFHSHPVAGVTSARGPTIVFQVLFPRPGQYRLWAQFQRLGRLSTIVFTVPVAARD